MNEGQHIHLELYILFFYGQDDLTYVIPWWQILVLTAGVSLFPVQQEVVDHLFLVLPAETSVVKQELNAGGKNVTAKRSVFGHHKDFTKMLKKTCKAMMSSFAFMDC